MGLDSKPEYIAQVQCKKVFITLLIGLYGFLPL